MMLFIKNIKQRRSSQKLSFKFIEFFRIANAVKKQMYRLILFAFYRIHDVFHIFYLESYNKRQEDDFISDLSSSKLIYNEKKYEIEEILQKKINKKIVYYLVK